MKIKQLGRDTYTYDILNRCTVDTADFVIPEELKFEHTQVEEDLLVPQSEKELRRVKVCGVDVELPNMKSQQAVFEYVMDWFAMQGCRSIGDRYCRYRTVEVAEVDQSGNKITVGDTIQLRKIPRPLACAVGSLVPDELYDKFVEPNEGQSVGVAFITGMSQGLRLEATPGVTSNGIEQHGVLTLLKRLQYIHDSKEGSYRRVGLVQIATDLGLKYEHIPYLKPSEIADANVAY